MTVFYAVVAPLLFGAATLAAVGVVGVVINSAVWRRLPDVSATAAPTRVVALLLVNPLNWLPVWLIGLPAARLLDGWK